MDTSGLGSSLSLVAFLILSGYLSVVEHVGSRGSASSRRADNRSRLSGSLRTFRTTTLVAVVLSALALVLGQSTPSVALLSVIALGLLAFLVALDSGARFLASRYPGLAMYMTLPFQALLSRLLRISSAEELATAESKGRNGKEHDDGSGGEHRANGVIITEEEEATLDARERLMIRSIMRLDESTAREIMVPRMDMVAVEAECPLPEVASRMLECGHSRLPVYRETMDNIIGIVHSLDLSPFLANQDEYSHLEEIIRPAFFIPEAKPLDELLRELQEKRIQMAMVVDEYGGIEGLATLEDLLEEIVGEIEDEFSRTHEPRVVPLDDDTVIVDARVTLDNLSDLFSISIDNEDVDTVGGLVYSALGKMPRVGDEVLHNGLRIEVVSLLGRRIRKLKLSKVGTLGSQ